MRVAVALVGSFALSMLPAQRTAIEDPLAKALASTAAHDVAWAAHFAHDTRDKTLVGPLLDAIVRWRDDESREGRDVCVHLLDALVGIDQPLPADEVVPLLDDPACGTAAFVLLARSPAHNEALLLAMFRREWADAPKAPKPLPCRLATTGDLLAAQRAPGFAPLVVTRLQRTLHVFVLDAPPAETVLPVRWRPRFPLPDWPPLPVYELVGPVRAAAVTGWQTVAVPRLERGTVLRQAPWFGIDAASPPMQSSSTGSTQPPELGWLCGMANVPTPVTILRHRYTTGPAFVDAVVAARTQREQALRRVRDELIATGALTAAQAAPLDGVVDVEVLDGRFGRGVALPAVPAAR